MIKFENLSFSYGNMSNKQLKSLNLHIEPVSYTHLDVYKRQAKTAST